MRMPRLKPFREAFSGSCSRRPRGRRWASVLRFFGREAHVETMMTRSPFCTGMHAAAPFRQMVPEPSRL